MKPRTFAQLVANGALVVGMTLGSVQSLFAQDNVAAAVPVAQDVKGANTLFLPSLNSQGNGGGGVDGLTVTKAISKAEQEAAMAFWSRGEVARTEPMAMPMDMGVAQVDMAALAQPEALGAPGMAGAGKAAPGAQAIAQAAYAEDWAALEGSMDDEMGSMAVDGTSQTFTSYFANKNVALHRIYPHIWVGRLSFSTPGGTSYCSGTSISNNILLTAAHCLYDTTNNRWYSNWVFSPAYRNGSAPYGTFAATQCWVLTSWVNLSGSYSINGWARHDVGVCRMGNNSAGQTLNNAVGWMGRQWNWAYARHFHNLGYPFRNTSDALITDAGKYLHACVAESFQQTTDTRGMGCDMSRGKSGGPLMTNYAPTVISGNADGVYSGFFIGTKNLYGARFTSNNIVPLCNAAGASAETLWQAVNSGPGTACRVHSSSEDVAGRSNEGENSPAKPQSRKGKRREILRQGRRDAERGEIETTENTENTKKGEIPPSYFAFFAFFVFFVFFVFFAVILPRLSPRLCVPAGDWSPDSCTYSRRMSWMALRTAPGSSARTASTCCAM
ncbi:MAG: trypsin-like serine protease [Anaerolineales bacterium]|nr:trypsin-like serine protease [Anaerolineales bacterium]